MDLNIQDKNTGDSHSAGEFNLFKAAINSKADKDALAQEISDRLANELVFEAAFQSKVNKTDYAVDYALVNERIDNISGGTPIDLTNYYTKYQSDNRFITTATTLFSGDYNDLDNLPSIPSVDGLASETWVESKGYLTGFTQDFNYNSLINKPSLFSGAYSDLSGKPNLSVYLTGVTWNDVTSKPTLFSGSYNDLTNRPDLSTKENTGVAQGLINDLKDGNAVDTIASLKTYITTLQGVDATIAGQISDLMAALDSDNAALDTLQEIVDYIEANRESIDAVLVDKLNKSVYDSFITGNTVALNNKVNVDGAKVLSDNNYSSTDKAKLASIASGATFNSTDAYLLNRTNHTGSQATSTITQTSTARFVTDAEKTTWSGKQDALGFTAVPTTRTVAGKPLSANITLVKADVGLENVDNTLDSAKPVSNATQTALNLKSDIVATQVTQTALTFTKDSVSGTVASPITGNITGNVTGALLGVVVLIIHNAGTAPTFDSKFKKLTGSSSYVVGQVNYIYCQYINATTVLYSINQTI